MKGTRLCEEARAFNKAFTKEMLKEMPKEKKRVLLNAILRNDYLTSYFGLSLQTVNVYKEGWYVKLEGVRAGFSVWVRDDDGKFIFGERKPKEDKISLLYSYDPELNESDFVYIVEEPEE